MFQALVLAAGKGTRMKSRLAKVLHRAHDRPLLEYVLQLLGAFQVDPIIVVTGHQAERVETVFQNRGLHFVRQDPQLGTGHAVQSARHVFEPFGDRPLLVLSGDTPLLCSETIARLINAHQRADAAATLLSCRLEEPGAYGRILRNEHGVVQGIVEAKDASPEQRSIKEINAGVYLFDVPALTSVIDRLNSSNAQKEIYLTDVVGLLSADQHRVQTVTSQSEREILGVNTMEELAQATKELRDERLRELMRNGVIVEDPSTTFVSSDCVVEADAVIRPFTLIEGQTIVRAGARIGPFVRLVDAEIGAKSEVLDHCFLRECVVGDQASIGPFAHIRPGSHIGARAKVGNFVELKNTSLGEGSKAPHLSYLGDSTIGPRVNVGAGTITCNYDGKLKHPTRIEAGAFVGSNATLVAPVTIGEGAYVAAGSTVTESVPPDALALGRARQVNKEGWAENRRAREIQRDSEGGR